MSRVFLVTVVAALALTGCASSESPYHQGSPMSRAAYRDYLATHDSNDYYTNPHTQFWLERRNSEVCPPLRCSSK